MDSPFVAALAWQADRLEKFVPMGEPKGYLAETELGSVLLCWERWMDLRVAVQGRGLCAP